MLRLLDLLENTNREDGCRFLLFCHFELKLLFFYFNPNFERKFSILCLGLEEKPSH